MDLSLSVIATFDGQYCNPANPTIEQRKLRKCLKQLSHCISNYSLISIDWLEYDFFKGLLLTFSHGLVSSICFDVNDQIVNVHHENFLITKLASRRVSNIKITEKFILVTYVEPYMTHVSLENNFKPFKKYSKFKIKKNCPVKTINLDRQNNRHVKRNLIVSGNKAILWWNTGLTANWPLARINSPTPNLLIYDLVSFNNIASESIDGEIIKNNFVIHDLNKFGLLYRTNDSAYTLTYSLYEIINNYLASGPSSNAAGTKSTSSSAYELSVTFKVNIPLEKLCLYAEFTQLQDKILLLCDDESVMLFNIEQNVLYSLHSSMSVCFIASNPFDAIFVTCNQYGQLSIYDYAFNNVSFTLQSKNSNMFNTQIKGQILKSTSHKMSIKRLEFVSSQMLALLLVDNKRHDSQDSTMISTPKSNLSCSLVLINLPYKVGFRRLINEYLYSSRYEEALSLLRVINWNCSFEEAYHCLNTIFQYLLKLPLNTELESHIESTLAAFLIPMTPIDYKIFEQILPYIRHLAIRFFYHLIRNESLLKAYQLGVELKSRRLFLLLYEICKQNGLQQLSASSYEQARNLI